MSTIKADTLSLLGLPAELRNLIFNDAFGTPILLVDAPTEAGSNWQVSDLYGHEFSLKAISSRGLEHSQPPRRNTRPLNTLVKLPSTCRQMRQEIAYSQHLFIVDYFELAGFIKQLPLSALPVIKTIAVTGSLQDPVDFRHFSMLTALEEIKVVLNFGLKDWHPMSRKVKLDYAERLVGRIEWECSLDIEVEFVTWSELFE